MSRETRMPWSRVGVMGLGATGIAAAGFLSRRGVEVIAADSKTRTSLPGEVESLAAAGVALTLGEESLGERVFSGCDLVVTSPGVPPLTPPLAGARKAGIPVRAEVELASSYVRGVMIGVTGSNGKSTVTDLAGAMLKLAGFETRVCGNIGVPLIRVAEADLAMPDEQARRVHYVVELSSFQLEGIERFRPRVAVLLNLSPDHMDRYETVEDYYAAKARIFMNQTGDDIAIINWDDSEAIRFAERLAARLFPFSLAQDLEEGALLKGESLILRRGRGDEPILSVAKVPLTGRHNLENVLAAASAAAHCGAQLDAIARAVEGFESLPHRLQMVAKTGGVSFYDDSKATNIGAARRALESFEEPVVLLLGGKDKKGDFSSLRADLSRPGRTRALVTFGQAAEKIARRLDGAAPRTVVTGSLDAAVAEAARLARPGDVVLLAPACASFDAYSGFAERGEAFRAAVLALAAGERGER